MAADRTLMAWIRTTLSMISFGFTIYKFYQYLYESGKLGAGPDLQGPRNLGLALIVLGLVSLAAASVQYAGEVRGLANGRLRPPRLTLVVAAGVSLIGTMALVNLLFGVGPF
jgi:putative membrane protein